MTRSLRKSLILWLLLPTALALITFLPLAYHLVHRPAMEALDQALDICARREVLVVAAAGNQGIVGSSPITRHPWVIPVVACDLAGTPLGYSNLGNSIGRFGLRAPGTGVTSLVAGPGGDGSAQPISLPSGTSVAVPFVTGAAALLRSHFPRATSAEVKLALTGAARDIRPHRWRQRLLRGSRRRRRLERPSG